MVISIFERKEMGVDERIAEFNSDDFDRKKAIREDYRNISYDRTYEEDLYDIVIESFYAGEKFLQMNEEQQEQIRNFFAKVKEAMNKPVDTGKFKIPKRFFLEAIQKAINYFGAIELDPAELRPGAHFDQNLKYAEGYLRYVKESDNRLDKNVGELLWDIYQRDDLSIGVHGTVLSDNFDISEENCDFFKHGIMVDSKYKNGDARRTVNFQDLPGVQWAFGHVDFLKLLNYNLQGIFNQYKGDGKPAQYSVIVVRPSSMQETYYQEDCPQELSIVSPHTRIKLNNERYLSGHLVKPEFVLGILKNHVEFVRNRKCDLDKLVALNEPIQKRNADEERRTEKLAEKLASETESVPAHKKRTILSILKFILHRGREARQEER